MLWCRAAMVLRPLCVILSLLLLSVPALAKPKKSGGGPCNVTPESLAASAKAYRQKSDFKRALPLLQGAVALSGQKPDYVLQLAETTRDAGLYDQAISEFERFQ